MSPIQYPLQEVLEIKKKRVENAEKILQQKRKELEEEIKKLEERKKEKETVLRHKNDKLTQLRDELDHGTTSPKIQQMKAYLKVVQEKLLIEEKKVKDQTTAVTNAEKKVEEAKEHLRIKNLEVDKLNTHKEDWTKERLKELNILEGRELDEIGNVMHYLNKKKNS